MKNKTVFVCRECGYESNKWFGRCPGCQSWNSMDEELRDERKAQPAANPSSRPVILDEVLAGESERTKTGISEFDRVLGGGIVKGSLVLVGGEPGIGKSTLLLQVCQRAAAEQTVLYISGEESERQIKLRAARLKINPPNLYIVSETNMDNAMEHIGRLKPKIVIVDSIQTMYRPELASAPGSVSQVRDAAMQLMRHAKESGTAVFLVGHVTKEGAIAGPRVLEHMVDCVLYFEGERHNLYRILRAVKNRFGSTNEIGVFEMTEGGLVEVENPSLMLLSGRPQNTPGSAVVCAMEGTRPILAEIQALVSPTGFGIPRRMASGIDYNRINMLIAVLEKRVGLNLQNQDVYINVIGGLKLDEPAIDLAAVCAIASSLKNKIVPPKAAIFGEVGLTGEIRAIAHAEKRVSEIKKLGFTECILPYENAKALKSSDDTLKIVPVKNVKDAIMSFTAD